MENPIPYCDVVTTTTHKTLRGPRWAIIMAKKEYESAIAKAVFPGVQGGPHENLIAAKAVAFYEALQPSFQAYAQQVIKNAKILADELIKLGYRLVTWWTDNHLVLVDVFGSKNVTWKEAEKALEMVGLSTNKNMIPYDKRKPLDPSWIRLWTPAATTRGMKEDQMIQIANLFDKTLKVVQKFKTGITQPEDKSQIEIFTNESLKKELNQIKQEVLSLCKKFPIY